MIQIQALLGPVGHCLLINSFNPNISAIILEPIVSDGSETLGTLATEIMVGEFDV